MAAVSPGILTFYYDNRKDDTREDRYYTYGAVIRMLGDSFDAEEPEKLGNYLPYTQGWGYYYTYIDGAGGDPPAARPPTPAGWSGGIPTIF